MKGWGLSCRTQELQLGLAALSTRSAPWQKGLWSRYCPGTVGRAWPPLQGFPPSTAAAPVPSCPGPWASVSEEAPRSLTPVLLCPASERWVVDVDRVVRLQRQLWARLAETEPELHQPGASQRGRLL